MQSQAQSDERRQLLPKSPKLVSENAAQGGATVCSGIARLVQHLGLGYSRSHWRPTPLFSFFASPGRDAPPRKPDVQNIILSFHVRLTICTPRVASTKPLIAAAHHPPPPPAPRALISHGPYRLYLLSLPPPPLSYLLFICLGFPCVTHQNRGFRNFGPCQYPRALGGLKRRPRV